MPSSLDELVILLSCAFHSADVGLNGVDTSSLAAGMVVCDPAWRVPMVTLVEARIAVLDVRMPILNGTQIVLHCHTASEPAQVRARLAEHFRVPGE